MEKENKLTCRNLCMYLFYKNKKKEMKWDENETLHLIMMMKNIDQKTGLCVPTSLPEIEIK